MEAAMSPANLGLLPAEVLSIIKKRGLGEKDVEALRLVCSHLWRFVSKHHPPPKEWTKYRRPLHSIPLTPPEETATEEKMWLSLVEELNGMVGLLTTRSLWMGQFLQGASSHKLLKIGLILWLDPAEAQGASKICFILSDFTNVPVEIRGAGNTYHSDPSKSDSEASCLVMVQDDRGYDNRDIFINQKILQTVHLRLNKRKTQSETRVRKEGVVGGSDVLKWTLEDGIGHQREQFLSFVSSSGGSGAFQVKLLNVSERLDQEQAVQKFKTWANKKDASKQSQRWEEIADARRLMALPATAKNPRPAPNGTMHAGRGLPSVPGLDCRLFAQARAVADMIYDTNCVLSDTDDEIVCIPTWAVAPGFSSRAQKKLEESISRKRKYLIGRGFIDSVTDVARTNKTPVKNVRGTTLVLQYKGTKNKVELSPLPCRILDSVEDDPEKYGSLLRSIAHGYHCWPETWWRVMTEYLRSETFKKPGRKRTGGGDEDLWIGIALVTDIECCQRGAATLIKIIREYVNRKTMVKRPGKFVDGCHLGHFLGVDKSNSTILLLLNFMDNSLSRMQEDAKTIVDKALPEAVRKYKLVNSDGGRPSVVKMGVKLVAKSVEGFKGERGNKLARFLRSWGRNPQDLALDTYDRVAKRKTEVQGEKSWESTELHFYARAMDPPTVQMLLERMQKYA